MASTLQRKIRKAKENGHRWSAEEVKAAEEAAEALFADPVKGSEFLAELVRKESENL